jgi:hypothetical protein
LTLVDKSFFKKTYKPKTQIVSNDNKLENQGGSSNCKQTTSFQTSAQMLFSELHSDRRQAKAVQNYRAKKLKKMFGTEGALDEAIAKHKALGLNLLLLQFIKRAPSGKSIYAHARARDSQGRFNGALLSKPHSSELSTIDLREDCRSESHTTAEGSLLSLLSLDNLDDQTALHFDFDTLFETSRRATRSLSVIFPTPQTESLPESPKATETPINSFSGAEKPFWEADGDLEDSLSYTHLPCNMFTEPLEDDLCLVEDL